MKLLFLLSTFCIVAGCASGNCHQKKDPSEFKDLTKETQSITQGAPPPEDVQNKLKTTRVKVYKYDGSLQCGMGKAIAPKDMEKELKAIKVHNRESRYDNLMRIQLCGSPTGKANVFEINQEDLAKAQALGFQLWTFESRQ